MGFFQARILKWVAIPFSGRSSQPRDQICISYIGRWVLYHWPPGSPKGGQTLTNQSLALARSWCLHSPGSQGSLPSLLSFYITSYEWSSHLEQILFFLPKSNSPTICHHHVYGLSWCPLKSAFLLWVGGLIFGISESQWILQFGIPNFSFLHTVLSQHHGWDLLQFLSKV